MILVLTLLVSLAFATRPPEPERAAEKVADLCAMVARGELAEQDFYPLFQRPKGSADSLRFVYEQDQERLRAALQSDGPLGRVLIRQPGVAAVVVGPDYTRVVLDTEPYLSFILVRQRGEISIKRWEITHCSDCREPVRFVTDLLADVLEDKENRLVPGMDLWLGMDVVHSLEEPEQDPTKPAYIRERSVDWRLAFQSRNLTAGYLRYVFQGAEVLGMDVEGVNVGLRDSVETWKVSYRDQRWQLDYQSLPADSVIRLASSDASPWRSESFVQQGALRYWVPLAGAGYGAGALWARHVVAIGYDPVRDRWLMVFQRPDRRVAHLVGLDPDGEVSLKVALPSWPARFPAPVPDWLQAWVVDFSPAGDKVLLSGAGRSWIVSLQEGTHISGNRGLMGNVTASAWSSDAQRVALGDERGVVGLFTSSDLEPLQLRYPAANGVSAEEPEAAVRGLAFSQAGEQLLVARALGVVEVFDATTLQVARRYEGLCCGDLQAMAGLVGKGEALLSCGASCLPLVAARLPLVGEDPAHHYSDATLMGTSRLSVSPEGRWVVLPYVGGGGSLALCRADDLMPLAVFGEIPPIDVAWSADGSAIMVLGMDGGARQWTMEELRRAAKEP